MYYWLNCAIFTSFNQFSCRMLDKHNRYHARNSKRYRSSPRRVVSGAGLPFIRKRNVSNIFSQRF